MTATRPATAPEQMPSSEGLPLTIHSASSQESAAAGGRDHGVDEGQRRDAVGFEVRSGVEAEPADPQQRGADHGHGQRVRSHQLLAVADALADDQRADQTGDAGIDVHHRAAGEVERARAWRASRHRR